jgi:hypothetical protein
MDGRHDSFAGGDDATALDGRVLERVSNHGIEMSPLEANGDGHAVLREGW